MNRLRSYALIASLALPSCAYPIADIDPSDTWSTYQRTGDHNTVISRTVRTDGWSINAGGQINGSLAINGDTLFVDTLAGDLLAISMRKQRVVWRAHVPNMLMSTPIIYNGMVFVGSGSSLISAEQSPAWGKRKVVMGVRGGDAIYAYDAATGRLRWSYHTPGENMASPVLVHGTLIFANGDFHAYALDAMNGRLLWKRDLSGIATMASAAFGNGRVFVSICDYRFPYHCETDALDPASGSVLWRAPYGDADSSPAYAKGLVFVSGLDYVRERRSWPALQKAYAVIAALDSATGKTRWVYRDQKPSFPSAVGTAERAVAGTYAAGKYFQAIPGRSVLLAFDATSGSVVWSFHSLAPIKMSPLYFEGRVYAGGIAGLLYELNASNGKLKRIRGFRQPFTCSPPVIVGRTMLITDNDVVHALPIGSKN